MFEPNKPTALRRMRLEELIGKLEQIEQQASLTLREYPDGLTLERQRLILAIAKQVQSHLRDQLHNGAREPLGEQPLVEASPPRRLRSVDQN